MKKSVVLSCAAVLFISNFTFATNRYVPAGGTPAYTTIQSAIDASNSGDIVFVRNGTYSGAGFAREVCFNSKNITVKSMYGPEHCILDCGGVGGTAFYIDKGTFDGFTVTNAYGNDAIFCANNAVVSNCIISNYKEGSGGDTVGAISASGSPTIRNCIIRDNAACGIICEPYSSPLIENCTITNNTYVGIFSYTANPTIRSCIISNNSGSKHASAIYCYSSSAAMNLINCVIANNKNIGGSISAIYCYLSSPTITNCTIADNLGAGISCITNSSPAITNCVLWGNNDDLKNAWADYSCVQDGDSGLGNISTNPQFSDPCNGDYHLKSTAGHWNTATQTWVTDGITSPCINTGDPSSDYSTETLPNGSRIDMGAYGGTAEASKSPVENVPVCTQTPAMDFNGDCLVNLADFAVFVQSWLQCNLQPETVCGQ